MDEAYRRKASHDPVGDTGNPAVAFFYGRPVPVRELSHFDWVVVQSEHLGAGELEALQDAGVQVFAYLSLGEAAPDAVEPAWVLGSNPAWGSVVVNPAAAGWRKRILDRADALWESGYRGIFLDTLDSYLVALPGAQARRTAGAAMADLIRAIHGRHPELQIFFNRGFEILDEVGALATGLAAESLLFGWDPQNKRYVNVSEPDRQWLASQLEKVKGRFGIPVVVVDYLPPSQRDAARDAARRIQAMGFTPWISTPSLDVLGVGSLEVLPRRVLLLYDGVESPSLGQSLIHRFAALPVEYLGFAADYLDVRRGLPQEPLAGRYAGIVTWFTDDEMPDSLGYPEWLLRQVDTGVRVAIFGRPGFAVSKSFLARLGIAAAPGAPTHPLRIVQRDELIGLEAEPALHSRGLLGWSAAASDVYVHLRLEDAQGRPIDPVISAPWGGMALDPYLVDVGYQGRAKWIVDPFSFLAKALAVGPAPALDLTTENGARLLVVVADGKGFGLPAGKGETSADVILRQVLAGLPVPTTVAIPVGELNPPGNGRAHSDLDALARAIFALPNVEPASHIGEAVVRPGSAPSRAIQINLASSSLQQDAGEPSLTQLSPSGCPVGDAFQVYVPGLSESGASSWWEARRFDREHLVALVERAESPRRLKPIGLYYHFWVATRPAALRSLKEALSWALDQGTLPLWSSEYAERVLDFRSSSIAQRLDGTWQFRGLGRLRTVRLPRSLGWPDLARSRGVAAVAQIGESWFVTFGPEERPTLALAHEESPGPYLAWANAPIERWSSQHGMISLRLRGHTALRFAVGGVSAGCTLSAHGRKIRPTRAGGRDTFSLAEVDSGDARLECGRE
jgi:uncharacterized protein (TIGR01370 family)